jgi:hypothetical protein
MLFLVVIHSVFKMRNQSMMRNKYGMRTVHCKAFHPPPVQRRTLYSTVICNYRANHYASLAKDDDAGVLLPHIAAQIHVQRLDRHV